MINRIPTTGENLAAGTPERSEYVSRTVSRALPCIDYLFRPVTPTSPVPDLALAAQINLKEWRLMAQISAERYRRYLRPVNPPQ
jgi:hypothetical protein